MLMCCAHWTAVVSSSAHREALAGEQLPNALTLPPRDRARGAGAAVTHSLAQYHIHMVSYIGHHFLSPLRFGHYTHHLMVYGVLCWQPMHNSDD